MTTTTTTLNPSGWVLALEPGENGTTGGDGAGTAMGMTFAHPDLPNARVEVNVYVVNRLEANPSYGELADSTTCLNCGESIWPHDGGWIHTAEGHEDAACRNGEGTTAESGDPYIFEVQESFELQSLDDDGNVDTVHIEYGHPYNVAFADELLAEQKRDHIVRQWADNGHNYICWNGGPR